MRDAFSTCGVGWGVCALHFPRLGRAGACAWCIFWASDVLGRARGEHFAARACWGVCVVHFLCMWFPEVSLKFPLGFPQVSLRFRLGFAEVSLRFR